MFLFFVKVTVKQLKKKTAWMVKTPHVGTVSFEIQTLKVGWQKALNHVFCEILPTRKSSKMALKGFAKR